MLRSPEGSSCGRGAHKTDYLYDFACLTHSKWGGRRFDDFEDFSPMAWPEFLHHFSVAAPSYMRHLPNFFSPELILNFQLSHTNCSKISQYIRVASFWFRDEVWHPRVPNANGNVTSKASPFDVIKLKHWMTMACRLGGMSLSCTSNHGNLWSLDVCSVSSNI